VVLFGMRFMRQQPDQLQHRGDRAMIRGRGCFCRVRVLCSRKIKTPSSRKTDRHCNFRNSPGRQPVRRSASKKRRKGAPEPHSIVWNSSWVMMRVRSRGRGFL
jgi:hypothetical protein